MSRNLHLSPFQTGAPATPARGLLIGVTRHPPRGVSKGRRVADGYFDVWLPTLAPEAKLVSQILNLDPERKEERERLFDRYERELLSFCKDESRSHRSQLYKIIRQAANTA